MKLAEALQERADLNRNIEQLKERLTHNALVQDGEQPAENPEKLKQELVTSISRLSYLISHINETNCNTFVEDVYKRQGLMRCESSLKYVDWSNVGRS